MNGAGDNLPYYAQVIALVATLFGAVIGVFSLIWAVKAARRAKGAREAAELAHAAAARAGRVARLSDLIADMQELQAMLARTDFAAIAGKANLIRGRVARFKTEVYTELGDEEKLKLNLARSQLESIAKVATIGRARDEHRAGQIQLAYGVAHEALNTVVALHGQEIQGD